jgi:hypothetical protein
MFPVMRSSDACEHPCFRPVSSNFCSQFKGGFSHFSLGAVLAILINIRRQKNVADISNFGGSSGAIFVTIN